MFTASFSHEIWDSRIIDFTSIMAASMEDDGITSERGPLGRGSVDTVGALVSLKYFSSAILKNTRHSANGYFPGETKIHETLKILSLENF